MQNNVLYSVPGSMKGKRPPAYKCIVDRPEENTGINPKINMLIRHVILLSDATNF